MAMNDRKIEGIIVYLRWTECKIQDKHVLCNTIPPILWPYVSVYEIVFSIIKEIC